MQLAQIPIASQNPDGSYTFRIPLSGKSWTVSDPREIQQNLDDIQASTSALDHPEDPWGSQSWDAQNEPGYQIPAGLRQSDSGGVEYDNGSWLANNWANLVAGGGLSFGLLSALGLGGAAAGAASSPPAGSGGAAAAGGAASGGAAAAGGAAKTGLTVSSLLGRGIPTAAGAIQGYLQSRKANELARTGQAIGESSLDPFRGVMRQATDYARLDAMGNEDFSPTQVQVDPTYGRGLNVAAMVKQPYTPNATGRGLFNNAASQVASGSAAAPMYSDPNNLGRPLPLARTMPPQPGPLPLDDENDPRKNPWLRR
jgi:hypothetical protein